MNGHRSTVLVHPDAAVLAEAVGARLITRLIDHQSLRHPVHIVLTGGGMGIASLAAIGRGPLRLAVDWSGVHLWWGDERFLRDGDPDRNETQAREAFINHLPALPSANVHPMPALGAPGIVTPEDSAAAYAEELARFAPEGSAVPVFDVVLLGMGPDAHVASLFPGNPALGAKGLSVVGVHDAPMGPSERVSFTFESIQAASEVWFVVAGPEKAEALAKTLAGAPLYEAPAGEAFGRESTLWLVDLAAATPPHLK